MKADNISVLVLAAGASSRMAGIKQLLSWDNKTLIEHALEMATSSAANKVYVVLGAHYDLIVKEVDQQEVVVIQNKNWADGIGSSIATGVKNILERENPDGILIMLCDQPLIDLDHLNSLIHSFLTKEYSVVGTSYENKIGVPAIFAAGCYPDLMKLEGDEGARSVIVKSSGKSIGISPQGKHADIDTDEDYSRLTDKEQE